MENPASWGPVERVIADALDKAEEKQEAGYFGWSTVKQIANALRMEGLLVDEPEVE